MRDYSVVVVVVVVDLLLPTRLVRIRSVGTMMRAGLLLLLHRLPRTGRRRGHRLLLLLLLLPTTMMMMMMMMPGGGGGGGGGGRVGRGRMRMRMMIRHHRSRLDIILWNRTDRTPGYCFFWHSANHYLFDFLPFSSLPFSRIDRAQHYLHIFPRKRIIVPGGI